jgi:hypothetical protein
LAFLWHHGSSLLNKNNVKDKKKKYLFISIAPKNLYLFCVFFFYIQLSTKIFTNFEIGFFFLIKLKQALQDNKKRKITIKKNLLEV